jgi:hypothetical protein
MAADSGFKNATYGSTRLPLIMHVGLVISVLEITEAIWRRAAT